MMNELAGLAMCGHLGRILFAFCGLDFPRHHNRKAPRKLLEIRV